jgi:mannose-1-phosphate guanylyltransferase
LSNAGIFLFRVRTLLAEMGRVCPDILEVARAACDARELEDMAGFERAFAAARSISIDYAVLEQARTVLTVPCSCGWTDLGSWEAVFEHRGGAPEQDVLDGPALSAGGHGNLVLAGARTVRVVGLEGVAVVDSPEGLLVMKLGASDALRKSVEESLVKA